jgi:hypothetical protein
MSAGMLNELAREIHRENEHWYDPQTGARVQRNIGEQLCLVHSEISEAMEGFRRDLMDDHLPHRRMAEVEIADAMICSISAARMVSTSIAQSERSAPTALSAPITRLEDPLKARWEEMVMRSVEFDRARSRKVMIATPIARHPTFQYMNSLVDTVVALERYGIAYERCFVRGVSILPQARNEIAARFLASDCDDLLCIDDDMGWGPRAVLRLLASDKPFCGAIYRKKDDFPPRFFPFNFHWVGEPGATPADEDGFVRFNRIGSGFMMVAREVFERLIEAHPDWKQPGPASLLPHIRERFHTFFRFLDNGEGTSEDYAFCDAWTALGGEIWIDQTAELVHVGEREFRGMLSPVAVESVPAFI